MLSSARKHKPPRPPRERVAKRNARKEVLIKCVPAPRVSSAPAPRESTAKSLRYPAAPVGQSPQTRRHHLTPTLVFKQTCTNVQVCAEHFFFSTGRGAFSF